ncbi:hypothetical protein M407DRAFT_242452 [Tulasnella calospora MUT 4182]|uniref:Uncharacterized protein n=1 Tax=Tulasnella calospora MUT 4182 TaxID=1051891 RepID=A0A0C3L7Z0_9AGAM|nr:hypothetical protein M407DRAFT_242452 [Tulasnella calospora MUT 4182]
MMWASRETLALLPMFHENLIFSDELCMVAGVTIARSRANEKKKWAAKMEYQKELSECIRAFKLPGGLFQEGEVAAVNAAVGLWI